MTAASVIDAVAPLLADKSGVVLMLAAVLARMSAIVFLAPGFGDMAIPVRVRLMIAIALVIVVAPTQAVGEANVSLARLASVLGAEAANGLIIGMSLRSIIFILKISGELIAQHMSLNQLFGVGISNDQESVLSTILVMACLAAAASAGVHVQIAALAVRTYEIFPAGAWPIGAEVGAWSAEKAARVFDLAFSLALPFVLLGLAYSLALAAASRAMPQLSAVFVGAPAALFAGMILFAATAPVIVKHAVGIFAESIGSAPWGPK